MRSADSERKKPPARIIVAVESKNRLVILPVEPRHAELLAYMKDESRRHTGDEKQNHTADQRIEILAVLGRWKMFSG